MQDITTRWKHWLAVPTAIGLWVASMKFSVAGFALTMPGYEWLGVLLAVSVTVLELIFNERPPNLTLYVFGLLAYVYSIATNFAGLQHARGAADALPNSLMGVLQPRFLLMAGLAAALDIVPEPLFLWGLHGVRGARQSDPLGAAFAGVPEYTRSVRPAPERTPKAKPAPRAQRARGL